MAAILKKFKSNYLQLLSGVEFSKLLHGILQMRPFCRSISVLCEKLVKLNGKHVKLQDNKIFSTKLTFVDSPEYR